MADSRKEQWRVINEISDRVGDVKESARKALYDMRKSMPRATSLGLEALKQMCEEFSALGARRGDEHEPFPSSVPRAPQEVPRH